MTSTVYILFRSFIFVIFFGFSASHGATPPVSGTCATLFESEFTIDAIFPDVGPGFFERFPYHMLPMPAALQEMMRTPLAAVQDNDPQPSSRYEIGKPFATLMREKVEAFTRVNPQWARVIIEFRNIQEFMPESLVNTYEVKMDSSPMLLLPREWQVKALLQLLNRRPDLKYAHRFQNMVRMATNTSFALSGEKPRQPVPPQSALTRLNSTFGWGAGNGYDGNLNPSAPTDFLLQRLRHHYFGDQSVIGHQDYKDALRKHLFYRLR